uniref:Uncharacterized protein n=1 Tax=Methylophaga nitratireducenticrescens TaxID=754476 RepID=I1XJX1_METNJ
MEKMVSKIFIRFSWLILIIFLFLPALQMDIVVGGKKNIKVENTH